MLPWWQTSNWGHCGQLWSNMWGIWNSWSNMLRNAFGSGEYHHNTPMILNLHTFTMLSQSPRCQRLNDPFGASLSLRENLLLTSPVISISSNWYDQGSPSKIWVHGTTGNSSECELWGVLSPRKWGVMLISFKTELQCDLWPRQEMWSLQSIK